MTKADATDFLNSKGFSAKEENGVVMIESADKEDYHKAERLLKKAGYNASFMWRKTQNQQTDG